MSKPVPPVATIIDHGAPTLAFDGVPALAHQAGMFSIVLSSNRPTVMTDGSIPMVAQAVCQLQCSREALIHLREAINKVLLFAADSQGSA